MANLQVARSVLREYNLKLILIECAFRVTSNKFHGFMFTSRGIEANLEKLWPSLFLNVQKPKSICNLLSLNNKISTLSLFLSISTESSSPFQDSLRPLG